MVLFGLAWIPFMDAISGQLYIYLQSVQAYISPPIAAVFLAGVLWPRANSRGALAALGAGFVLGIGRLVLEMNKTALTGWIETLASSAARGTDELIVFRIQLLRHTDHDGCL